VIAMTRLAIAVVVTAGLGFVPTTAGGGNDHLPRAGDLGVVDIRTRLALPGMGSAGTGIVVGRKGEVLTNNHVVRGAVQIRVITPAGRRYSARVLGTDPAHDVALLKLRGASSLTPARLGDSSRLALRQRIRSVGNAKGAGGAPAVAGGHVTGLNRSISTTGELGLASEHLKGLIRTDAQLEPGYSGGPLLDDAGKVVGVDTAARVDPPGERRAAEAFAIPINDAMAIVRAVEAGRASGAVHIGPTPAVGVMLVDGPSGAGGVFVGGVVPGSPADAAGLIPGALIMSLDGSAVPSSTAFSRRMQRHRPGDKVRLRWFDLFGGVHAATVQLVPGLAE
jgi:S1-C subfamily serine protease